ncbi:MAG: K(+)-transporting ATPase subunit C [Candidatus Eremiobacteraeota bacterium]|nr:K(+)-transporting ATPase subunit C [Candidatus Eremiobacteraeota bacterium]MCW5871612.1 K(+)-transporting ATPase subunit C [Candidatus Eremiobacteraeota bacterium]
MVITAIRQLLLWTLVCGLLYPLLVTGLAQAMLSRQANGQVKGLVGQDFSQPGYFYSRPSATAGKPYNAAASSGTNFGPNEPKREEQTVRFGKDAPADLRYASGSGLDPHITPEAARYQAERVARERNLSVARVEELIGKHTEGPSFGVLGHARVNVVLLNAALDNRGASK